MLIENAAANSTATIRFRQVLKHSGALSLLRNLIPLQDIYIWLIYVMLIWSGVGCTAIILVAVSRG